MRKKARLMLPFLLLTALIAWGSRSAGARYTLQATLQPAQSQASPPLTLTYTNKKYRFRFHLPESWKGYSVIAETWSGGVFDEEGNSRGDQTLRGPLLRIRSPRWTEADHYQDIPIMIFTKDQWRLVDLGRLVVSAAPFGPEEIGRNSHFVFALPPRYNYADAEGIEEVVDLIQRKPLQAY